MEKRIELEMRGRPAAQVTELNLDNCRSTNIEGLTEEFANLTKLSLINVGLTSLKGFPKLPKLKKLELSDNRISNGLAYLSEATPNITNLNLSGNRLKDMESLKPLEKLAHLEVLDTFNNEATSVDNYREKLFAMIPSLKYLDGFDPKEGEAPSEGEDDEDGNGFPGSDDEQSAFNINGLEIDLEELDAFERKVAEKKGQQMVGPDTPAEAPDYLDEYLERLQISRQGETDESKEAEKNKNIINNENYEDTVPLEDQPVSRYSFIRLLLLFMSLVSMAKLLKYGEGGDSDDGEDDGESDVSLSEVMNEELADDSSDWDEDAASEEGEEDDLDEDSEEEGDVSAADVSGKKKDESTASVDVAAEDDEDSGEEEEDGDAEESRGKKRKHDD